MIRNRPAGLLAGRRVDLRVAGAAKVGLFATCLVDLFRPSVGLAAAALLEDVGLQVVVPPDQTCCGQPAYNSGARDLARNLAKRVINTLEGYDVVVLPSGSCAGMICKHYPGLLGDDLLWSARAQSLARRTFELLSFLAEPGRAEQLRTVSCPSKITYHDSCSGLRELGIKQAPRQLLDKVEGLQQREMQQSETCCGFGGTFCVKYPEIADYMVDIKSRQIEQTGADTLLGGDMGCLLHLAGRLKRRGSAVRVRHTAEVLAGVDVPPIAQPQRL